MFGNAFGWPHLIIILAVVILLFGATKLPALSKSLGQSIKIFRKEMHDVQDDRKAVARDEAERVPVYTDEPPAASDEPRRATGASSPQAPGSPQR